MDVAVAVIAVSSSVPSSVMVGGGGSVVWADEPSEMEAGLWTYGVLIMPVTGRSSDAGGRVELWTISLTVK